MCTQVRNPEDYRLTFRTPPGCNVSINCTSFVGIDINAGNNGVLDIYMEGLALGWVAVGFTKPDNNMVCAQLKKYGREFNFYCRFSFQPTWLPATETQQLTWLRFLTRTTFLFLSGTMWLTQLKMSSFSTALLMEPESHAR